jgi:hypothetical protein
LKPKEALLYNRSNLIQKELKVNTRPPNPPPEDDPFNDRYWREVRRIQKVRSRVYQQTLSALTKLHPVEWNEMRPRSALVASGSYQKERGRALQRFKIRFLEEFKELQEQALRKEGIEPREEWTPELHKLHQIKHKEHQIDH